ncbi:MAG: transglycosylase family protein [Actinomycetota bacterium]|nr:transglycosylase family protein [Actinomycetota bacterium]
MAVLAALALAAVPAEAGQVDEKRAEAAAVAEKLQAQAGRIVALDKQHRAAQGQLAQAEAALARAELDLAVTGRRHDDARRLLVVHAQQSYVSGGSVSFLANMVGSDGDDVTVRRTYLRIVTGEDSQAIGRLRAAGEDLRLQRSRLAEARRKAGATAEAIAEDRDALESAVASQRALLGRLNGEVASMVAAEQARRDAESGRLATARRPAAGPAPAPRSAGPVATPAPNPAAPAAGSSASIDETFACIRQLESGNNYKSPGGGAYQFLDSTWQSLGYEGTASDHPPAVQDKAARELLARSGWSQWTTAKLCGRV